MRLGLTPGHKSRSLEKEMGLSLVKSFLAVVQDSDAWGHMPAIAPLQVFDSSVRRIVTARSATPLRARSGPTLSALAMISAAPYKIGEQIMTGGIVVIDGGWVFFMVRKRHYGNLEREGEAHGWLCTRARNYATITLKE